MQNSQLQKAINLAKKTGDRLIVFDPAKEDSAYVVMSIDQYEDLTLGRGSVRNLTEDQLLDKINRDIAVWKNENDFSAFESKNSQKSRGMENADEYENYEEDESEDEEFGNIEDMYRDDFSSPGLRNINKNISKDSKRSDYHNHWSIPSTRKEAAEEVVDEEERQYLEEVPF
jgi:hypothetical protein